MDTQPSALGLSDEICRDEGRRLFGLDPEGYDAARPGHPDRVYRVLVERCGLGTGTSVLEIGPGTGQATRRLLELGADVVAIEPDPRLADYLARDEPSALTVRNKTLEEVDIQSNAFDVAVAASSFHWVDEDAGLSKILAALRPGRWVALWWTLFGDDEHPDRFQRELDSALDDVYRRVGTRPVRSPSAGREGGPRFALDVEARRAAFNRAGFERFSHELIPWTFTWDTAGIRGLFASFSPIIRLENDARAVVLDTVTRVAEDSFGGLVVRPLRTSLFTARRPQRRRGRPTPG